jgi:hypothetical protein
LQAEEESDGAGTGRHSARARTSLAAMELDGERDVSCERDGRSVSCARGVVSVRSAFARMVSDFGRGDGKEKEGE